MLRVHAQNEGNRQLIGNHLHSLFPRNLRTKNQETIQRRRRLNSTRLPEKTALKALKLAEQIRATRGHEEQHSDH